MAETETVEGVVTSLTQKGDGFKIDDGEWINFSKRNFTGPKPSRGDRVAALCEPWEGKLWAKSVRTLQAAASSNGGGSGAARGESIERSVCLKAAVDMGVANLARVPEAERDVWTLTPQNVLNVARDLMEFFAPEQEPEPAPPEDRGEP